MNDHHYETQAAQAAIVRDRMRRSARVDGRIASNYRGREMFRPVTVRDDNVIRVMTGSGWFDAHLDPRRMLALVVS